MYSNPITGAIRSGLVKSGTIGHRPRISDGFSESLRSPRNLSSIRSVTSDEEESTIKRLFTRVADAEDEKTAGRDGGWAQFILPSGLCSIFITTTVRYHGDNKHINNDERTEKHGITLKPLVRARGELR